MLRVTLAILLVPGLAAADPTQLGAFFGPRIFSGKSTLGYIDDAPAHPMLHNSIELGVRAARQFGFPWLFPELELAFAPTHTSPLMVNGAMVDAVNVYWFEPRAQLRFELAPKRPVEPFIVIGGGTPIAVSGARKTINSGIIGDGYAGAGARFDTHKGFALRIDARLAVLPGVDPATGDNKIAFEGDIGIGLEMTVGVPRQPKQLESTLPAAPADRDDDGIPDNVDKCPDRPEDKDGFEDADGCPDIDNDNDHVLDIADKCPMEPETMNGFEDDDGCPDTVPADVDGLKGTIEGLLYAEGETAVRDSAKRSLENIKKVMDAHPSVKIVLIGHTDDREAKAFAEPPAAGKPAPDLESLNTDLARARAEAVREALTAIGVPQGRIVVDGVGAEEPVADNNSAKGRLANRRVELKLFVAH
ncbi:MAG: OmpA family protein [Deltaproteobacteria bacterium]|nr:OmpA family protein [Deltaproteobacteria bacterium]